MHFQIRLRIGVANICSIHILADYMHILLFRSQFLTCFRFNVSINQIVGYIHLFLVKLLNSSFSRNMFLLFSKLFKPVESTSCTSIVRFFMLFESPFLVKSPRFPRIFFRWKIHPESHSRNGVPCPKDPEIKKSQSWEIVGIVGTFWDENNSK